STIHKASRGIPRRINSLCDRLLLLGFMAGRTQLTQADVEEVVKDFRDEAAIPDSAHAALATSPASVPAAHLGQVGLDIDVGQFNLPASTGQGMSAQILNLAQEHHTDRLQRLERSLMRLERINLQTLALLQKLVDAASSREGREGSEP
ncbi:MAG TPA: ATPase, partial [Burkholderiaceae bacterium]|nr:ATPase [Burkholderiaceae bacterium]